MDNYEISMTRVYENNCQPVKQVCEIQERTAMRGERMESAERLIRPQWRLDEQNEAHSLAPPYSWGVADDHKTLHFVLLPQRQLRTLIGMIIQARISHAQDVLGVLLPIYGMAR